MAGPLSIAEQIEKLEEENQDLKTEVFNYRELAARQKKEAGELNRQLDELRSVHSLAETLQSLVTLGESEAASLNKLAGWLDQERNRQFAANEIKSLVDRFADIVEEARVANNNDPVVSSPAIVALQAYVVRDYCDGTMNSPSLRTQAKERYLRARGWVRRESGMWTKGASSEELATQYAFFRQFAADTAPYLHLHRESAYRPDDQLPVSDRRAMNVEHLADLIAARVRKNKAPPSLPVTQHMLAADRLPDEIIKLSIETATKNWLEQQLSKGSGGVNYRVEEYKGHSAALFFDFELVEEISNMPQEVLGRSDVTRRVTTSDPYAIGLWFKGTDAARKFVDAYVDPIIHPSLPAKSVNRLMPKLNLDNIPPEYRPAHSLESMTQEAPPEEPNERVVIDGDAYWMRASDMIESNGQRFPRPGAPLYSGRIGAGGTPEQIGRVTKPPVDAEPENTEPEPTAVQSGPDRTVRIKVGNNEDFERGVFGVVVAPEETPTVGDLSSAVIRPKDSHAKYSMSNPERSAPVKPNYEPKADTFAVGSTVKMADGSYVYIRPDGVGIPIRQAEEPKPKTLSPADVKPPQPKYPVGSVVQLPDGVTAVVKSCAELLEG